MRHALALAAVLLLILAVFLPPGGAAQESVLPQLQHLENLRGLVNVDADNIEYLAGQRAIVARGGVRATFGDALITADEVTVDLDDQSLVATGNVTMIRPAAERGGMNA